MSSSMFVQSDSSALQTRRTATTNDVPAGSASAGRRSLSGKFRNLFRRSSPSPKRRFNGEDEPATRRPTTTTTIETPQLRTPTIPWPFGRKSKTPTPDNSKSKAKPTKKAKQKTPLPTPTSPVERPASLQNYDSLTTKGFRDYMVIDQGTSSKQTNNEMPVDIGTHQSDRSRSPSIRQDASTFSKIDLFVKPEETSAKTSVAQLLASEVPLMPRDSGVPSPPIPVARLDLSESMSSSSSSSSSAAGVPMVTPTSRTPSVSFGQTSTKFVDSDGFVPEREMLTRLREDKYPGLSSIVDHHLRPFRKEHFRPSEPSNSTVSNVVRPPPRFEASTTTLEPAEERAGGWATHWNNDGFIRPLTPDEPKPSFPHPQPKESPVIYRSSTMIYTRDKHRYVDGGELLTWSVRETKPEENSLPRRLTNSIHIDRHYYDRSEVENLRSSAYDYPPHVQPDEKRSNFVDSTSTNGQIEAKQDSAVNRIRHHVLKRTDSYDGLGILLSADVDTRLQHCIRDVEVNSPAYRVGLRKNDRILGVNGVDVENVEFADVLLLIKQGLIANHLQLTVVNDPTLD